VIEIAIPIYDRLTALDAVGPFEVVSRLPEARVAFVAREAGPKRTDNGMLAVTADLSLREVPSPDVVVVPGGLGSRQELAEEETLSWLREVHERTRFTTSVCTGSLILGAAGILDGLEATSHWLSLERLASFGARPVRRRVVEDGKVVTAAGVSAGIDMALMLAARIAGDEVAQAIQLAIEYDPQPPFESGSPQTAPHAIVERLSSGAGARSARPRTRTPARPSGG
jgi:transcriptional regulator GlxA family with amidase domain